MSAAMGDGNESRPFTSSSIECHAYEYPEILIATNNFDQSLVIGEGGFGIVYKGEFVNESGVLVAAIKRLINSEVTQADSQFWAEVETLSKLRHCNLVPLIGYCSYGREMILVYQYMPNGTLEDNLHKLGTYISWRDRLQICLDAARGLDYLHTGTGIDVGIMHRDVKSSNILLDESWGAKISDFGLSILGPTDQPLNFVNAPVPITRGYVDLDYYYSGMLTSKCDVYNFGVVLLEVVCRKRALDSSLGEEQCVLVTWAQDSIRKGNNLNHIVDSGIRDEISRKCLKQFVQIVDRCLHNDQKQRPTMAEVVLTLESILILQKNMSNSLVHPGSERIDVNQASIQWSQVPCRHFEFPEILLATNNFDESLVIGKGGFGRVYKGNIINGSSVVAAAIKRLDSTSKQGAEEFRAEVDILSKVHHCHIVSLIGFCDYEEEMIIIYEYMSKGSLADHLHKLGTPLPWLQRLKICIGAARGLDYLHTGTGIGSGLIYRDVKPSNILLHESWAAKISDMGLTRIIPTNHPSTYVDTPSNILLHESWAAKIPDIGLTMKIPTNHPSTYVSTLVKGTIGYIDPDYYRTGKLTRKSDVYSFGVVLLELLCRRRVIDRSLDEQEWNVVELALKLIKEGKVKDIVDSGIIHQISQVSLKEFVRLAQRCLHESPEKRPTMAEVVVCLDYILTLYQPVGRTNIQPGGRTIFGQMADKLSFHIFDKLSLPSNGQTSADNDSKLASNSKGKRRNNDDSVEAHNKYFTISTSLKEFKLADLERATQNFSQYLLLGKQTGEVFLGWVDMNTFAPSTEGAGVAVAVKRFSRDLTECQTAVTVLGHLAHPNIISLVGYCGDKKHKRFLVYEYMQNHNLDHFLFSGDVAESLSWGTRLRIMIGVARGLVYIHTLEDQVIHRDLKASNILLDQDFNAKLGGFGMAKFGPETRNPSVSTRIIGTLGYIDPVYATNGHVSVKSDIYSFGALLLETLTGKRAWETQRSIYHFNMGEGVNPLISDINGLERIMDPRLEQNYQPEGAFQCVELALRCSAKDPKDRPSSEEVLRSLEQIYTLN
ncbi:hypothetical protein LXL04_026027 [Taraxacum kok-saghyz]